METKPKDTGNQRSNMEGKLRYLAISMVLFFVLYPFLENGVGQQIVLNAFISAICLFAVYAVSGERWKLVVALVLGTPWFVGTWLAMLLPGQAATLGIVASGFCILFYAFTAVSILVFVLKAERVRGDVLYGAVCIYMLIGGTFTVVFSLIEGLHPGSFYVSATLHPGGILVWTDFMYYSYATLTTLGYGDIVPVSSYARSFAVMEAVMGVMYLAIIISRLVGLYIAQASRKEPA